MRTNLAGLLINAALVIEYADDEDEFGIAAALREVAVHAVETREGRHTLAEFATGYCLADPAPPAALTEADYCPL